MGGKCTDDGSGKVGGAEGIRTPDPHNAIVVLYQLSYDPIQWAENLRATLRFVKVFSPLLEIA